MEARLGIAGVEYPVRPMIAVPAQQLPTSHPGGWSMEPKLDGFRCIAHRGPHRVALQSRQLRPLGRYFPEIVTALGELNLDVVLDGELCLWRKGRVDFAALQQRLHPSASRARELSVAMPASYVTGARTGSQGGLRRTMFRSEQVRLRRAQPALRCEILTATRRICERLV